MFSLQLNKPQSERFFMIEIKIRQVESGPRQIDRGKFSE